MAAPAERSIVWRAVDPAFEGPPANRLVPRACGPASEAPGRPPVPPHLTAVKPEVVHQLSGATAVLAVGAAEPASASPLTRRLPASTSFGALWQDDYDMRGAGASTA